MALEAKLLTAQQAARMWRQFYKAYGPEVMLDAYWWESPKDAVLGPGEYCWQFTDSDLDLPSEAVGLDMDGRVIRKSPVIGWGTCQLQLDVADDDEAVMAAGVFPQYQRRGYRTRILDWMCEWAKEKGATYAVTNTNNSNKAQIDRKMKEADAGGLWLLAGEIFIPAPGYTVFKRDLSSGDES